MKEKIKLLLLPGLLCDADLWLDQSNHLKDIADIQVADMSVSESMAELATKILDMAPPRFALAGFSMGGYCALEMMAQAPKRISHLALVDSSARADTDEQTARRIRLIRSAKEGNFISVIDELLPHFVHPDRLQDAKLIDTIRSMAIRIGEVNFVRQQKIIMSRVDRQHVLATIDCPVTVVYGKDDLLTPSKVNLEMAEAIDGAVSHAIEHCGHFAPLESPGAVTRFFSDWLNTNDNR